MRRGDHYPAVRWQAHRISDRPSEWFRGKRTDGTRKAILSSKTSVGLQAFRCHGVIINTWCVGLDHRPIHDGTSLHRWIFEILVYQVPSFVDTIGDGYPRQAPSIVTLTGFQAPRGSVELLHDVPDCL
jgi:hypothetical protein